MEGDRKCVEVGTRVVERADNAGGRGAKEKNAAWKGFEELVSEAAYRVHDTVETTYKYVRPQK